jgi:hypothetical protein
MSGYQVGKTVFDELHEQLIFSNAELRRAPCDRRVLFVRRHGGDKHKDGSAITSADIGVTSRLGCRELSS